MDTILVNIDKMIAIALLLALSVVFRQVLILAQQQWISTFAHTATLFTLPIVTYVITSVISGNIALSLGMVGALSIIRFRNPVKSPFELVVYFTMITMGIAASVDPKWLLLLAGTICGTVLLLRLADLMSIQTRGISLFRTSFTEGNELATLEVVLAEDQVRLAKNPNLVARSYADKEFRYVFAAKSSSSLLELQNDLLEDGTVTSSHLTV